MITHATMLRYNNCNHDIDLYFEGKFVKDDYCDVCLDQIDSIETHE